MWILVERGNCVVKYCGQFERDKRKCLKIPQTTNSLFTSMNRSLTNKEGFSAESYVQIMPQRIDLINHLINIRLSRCAKCHSKYASAAVTWRKGGSARHGFNLIF